VRVHFEIGSDRLFGAPPCGRELFCHSELFGQLYKIVVTEKPIGLKEGRGEISEKVSKE
jgi:hypothetical protein